MSLYDDWKTRKSKTTEKLKGSPNPQTKETGDRIKGVGVEGIPSAIKRCPKCHELSLELDVKTGRIHCDKCGFEENLPMME